MSDDESDDLDALEDPRILELESEEDEEPPKLVKVSKAQQGKGKNKRLAESDEEEGDTLDNLISKVVKPAEDAPKTNGEQKLSKKQLKKLKKNDGQAAPAKSKTEEDKKSAIKDSPGSGKKVQFAKNLEQGPTGSPKVDGKQDDKSKNLGKVSSNKGVGIDDRKVGSGPAAKKGDRLGMRYIGKLVKDGKQFDANKKGMPFKFKLGAGEVIKGWDIGVEGMKVGGERRLTVPARLAYGSQGMAGIPANSDLQFDVKLLSIN
ncbi:hypothetical protein NA57DRAFT_34240 [Rhizodiscina lignyota]|uniref:peptidylprolyl isomerase n=1 Tax=Rhizodiscina lignyota TaxID=1504668 RepID=A0A9P4M9E7_9PEZI|nr:hypothetical protein NA57DRAFT_34240 [Rhizodiscina lignyota]